ncbi:MAG: hypothetical protein R3C56_08765 [Pirellulaceae bacterium]
MSSETNDRYTTALDMASDLEKYLADARVSVCRDGFGTSLVRVIRKNRTASLMLPYSAFPQCCSAWRWLVITWRFAPNNWLTNG